MAAALSSANASTSPPPTPLPLDSQSPLSQTSDAHSQFSTPPKKPLALQTQRPRSNVDPTHSQSQSRHTSAVFPLFHSSLAFALVRDFAYASTHPMHYGPLDDTPSGQTTPNSSFDSSRRTSDPPSWGNTRSMFGAGPWGDNSLASQGQQLPSTSFGSPEGEEWSDEENTSVGRRISKHRKSKSYASMDDYTRGRRRNEGERGKKATTRTQPGLDSEGMFTSGSAEGGPPSHVAGSSAVGGQEISEDGDRTDSPFSSTLPNRPYPGNSNLANSLSMETTQAQHPPFRDDPDGVAEIPGEDEAFAGPSLALYEFKPENDNELALTEGQIIQVGYRHGQGWLVAMNLETGEQGLVPEEYVRLLRDIEGWGEEEADASPDQDAENSEDVSQSEPSEHLDKST